MRQNKDFLRSLLEWGLTLIAGGAWVTIPILSLVGIEKHNVWVVSLSFLVAIMLTICAVIVRQKVFQSMDDLNEMVANWDSTQANDKMLATWSAHPEIEVVFANNDDMAIGVIAALNQSGYNTGNEGDPAITVIGVDATDAAFEAIKAGKMTATVQQDGDAMGKANIRIAANYLLNGAWLDGLEADYPLAADGYSVRIPYAKITDVE